MTKEDRVKEDKKFIGQYPGKASALFDSLVRSDKTALVGLSIYLRDLVVHIGGSTD